MKIAGALVVLVHSPLVGPSTWAPAAAALQERGVEAVVPELEDREDAGLPLWRQHADSVARQLTALPATRPLILVGHSGAGPLLPAIAEAVARPVAAYVFVDAGLPRAGSTRLDLLRSEAPAIAKPLGRMLRAGGRYPEWSDAGLQPLLPDADQRRRLLAELRPRVLAFWEEPIPVFDAWPDAHCAYLQFSPSYARPAARAQELGWPFRTLNSGHFHLLVDPPAVAHALLDLIARLGGRSAR